VFYTYILASRRNGTLYAGSTDDLARRIYEHRERQMRKWNRAWKLELIKRFNPAWRDLSGELI
jgi:putative endonuclease